MEMKQLFFILRRWYWLLILGLVFGLFCGFLASSFMAPVYQGVAKILVSRNPDSATAEFPSLSNTQLVQTYVELLQTEQIRDRVSEVVGKELDKMSIMVEQLRDTQIIQIAVEDENASRAVFAANTFVSIIQEQNNKLQADQYLNAEQSLEEQIAQAKAEIDVLQAQIDEYLQQDYQAQLDQVNQQIITVKAQISQLVEENFDLAATVTEEETTPPPEIAENEADLTMLRNLLSTLQSYHSNLLIQGRARETGSSVVESPQLEQLRSTLRQYEDIYFSHLRSLDVLRLTRLQNFPTIVLIEPATIPEKPIRPLPALYTVLAGVAGLAVAILAMVLIEYLDESVKTQEDVESVTGAVVLGMIRKVNLLEGHLIKDNDVNTYPAAVIYEDYRSLGYQIELQGKQKPIRSILVTSQSDGEGKTTTSVNLASIFSSNGDTVFLMDANLQHPQLYHLFDADDRVKVMDLKNGNLESSLFQTKQTGNNVAALNVIGKTEGGYTADSADGIKQISWMLDQLNMGKKGEKNSCLVIIDAPPASSVDAKILASKTDAVLLVVDAWHTQKKCLQDTLNAMKQVNANILGVVMNRVPAERAYHAGDHIFFQPQKKMNREDLEKSGNKQKSLFQRIFKRKNPSG